MTPTEQRHRNLAAFLGLTTRKEPNPMTASELKYQVENSGQEQYFFTHETMRFFGDTMRNYGVRSTVVTANFDANGQYVPDGVTVKVWELYRKSPVKHGMKSSAYFDQDTFRRIHPKV